MTSLTEKQQAIRRVRFPASSGAGFLGYSPYGGPLKHWQVHMGLVPFEGNANTEAGTISRRRLRRQHGTKWLTFGIRAAALAPGRNRWTRPMTR